MNSEQIERERRNGRIAAALAILGIAAFVASFTLATDFAPAERAERLALFESLKDELLAQYILQGIGYLLFTPALVLFFRAVSGRSSAVRHGLIGVIALSTILLAGSAFASYFSYEAAADAFFAPDAGVDTESNDDASDVYLDQFATQLVTGFGLAGSLSALFALVYTSLQAMRAGLMTRFAGTLGMALGVGTLLFGPPMLLVFMILLSLLLADLWPGGRPPAWAAGKAIPWPQPGQQVAATTPTEEPARPEDFEGSATELESERPGRRDNKRKRKRKQRD